MNIYIHRGRSWLKDREIEPECGRRSTGEEGEIEWVRKDESKLHSENANCSASER